MTNPLAGRNASDGDRQERGYGNAGRHLYDAATGVLPGANASVQELPWAQRRRCTGGACLRDANAGRNITTFITVDSLPESRRKIRGTKYTNEVRGHAALAETCQTHGKCQNAMETIVVGVRGAGCQRASSVKTSPNLHARYMLRKQSE